MRTPKETNVAKLRNKLGPAFNLPSMVVGMHHHSLTTTSSDRFLYEEAKRVIESNDEIKVLLARIENELEKLQKFKNDVIKDEADNRKF